MPRKLTTSEFIEKAKKIHGDKYDYSLVEYVHSNIGVKIICPKHGIFLQKAKFHINNHGGCSKCGIERVSKILSSNTIDFINKSVKVHGNKYDYSKSIYGKNCSQNVIIICPSHGEFFQQPNNHLRGKGCPICNHIISKQEIEFLDFLNLEKRNVSLMEWKRKPVDGYDKQSNTIYEFLGDYYHGNPKIFNTNDYNKTCHKTFGELYKNTFQVFDKVKTFGYKINYIWESDWKRFKNGIDKIPNIISYR